ncbi:MAG: hypothetical protein A2V77_25135 [Anaeromyxobacter sp. RBG_16_69_14]|nr:MAG: hypothetical protein A2V77_25135 [Anaeromyxobacter sp. RBG_16_69_14]
MPRLTSTSIDEVVQRAVQDVIARASRSIATAIAEMAAAELEEQLSVATKHGRASDPARRAASRRPRREELTKWVADHRARRVPTFVIELTGGLDTKKKIVAKFGEDAVFERGRPLPKAAKAA